MGQVEGLDRLLKEHPFFADMSEEMRQMLAGCASNERYDAGDYIFRESEPADKFYLIRSGTVSVQIHVPGRDPIMLQTLHDGDIMGWSWLIPPYRWTYDVRALQLARLVSLDAVCLRAKCEADHSLGYELMKRFLPVIAERLSAARLQLIDMYGSPKERMR